MTVIRKILFQKTVPSSGSGSRKWRQANGRFYNWTRIVAKPSALAHCILA